MFIRIVKAIKAPNNLNTHHRLFLHDTAIFTGLLFALIRGYEGLALKRYFHIETLK